MSAANRSLLYVPGSKSRALEKAATLAVDGIIIDLEDAVAPDQKIIARDVVTQALAENDYGNRKVLLRINAFDTDWGNDDLAWAIKQKPSAILLPKVENAKTIERVADAIGNAKIAIWAMMETPLAVLNAQEIASSSDKLEGFVLGTNDLAKDMHARTTPNRSSLITAISWILTAARAYDKICVDGVYNAFTDEQGLEAECIQGRDLGMDGKSLIHPSQIEITNRIFAPDPDEIALAHRYVTAFDEAIARGEAVAVVDGKIVENLHVASSRRLIALDDAIKANEAQ